MVNTSIEMYTVITGGITTLAVGTLSFVIRNSISKNATKENVKSKTDLLHKDITHLSKELISCDTNITVLHKRVSDLRDSSKEIYVSKEVFQNTINQLNDKLDTIIKFVKV